MAERDLSNFETRFGVQAGGPQLSDVFDFVAESALHADRRWRQAEVVADGLIVGGMKAIPDEFGKHAGETGQKALWNAVAGAAFGIALASERKAVSMVAGLVSGGMFGAGIVHEVESALYNKKLAGALNAVWKSGDAATVDASKKIAEGELGRKGFDLGLGIICGTAGGVAGGFGVKGLARMGRDAQGRIDARTGSEAAENCAGDTCELDWTPGKRPSGEGKDTSAQNENIGDLAGIAQKEAAARDLSKAGTEAVSRSLSPAGEGRSELDFTNKMPRPNEELAPGTMEKILKATEDAPEISKAEMSKPETSKESPVEDPREKALRDWLDGDSWNLPPDNVVELLNEQMFGPWPGELPPNRAQIINEIRNAAWFAPRKVKFGLTPKQFEAMKTSVDGELTRWTADDGTPAYRVFGYGDIRLCHTIAQNMSALRGALKPARAETVKFQSLMSRDGQESVGYDMIAPDKTLVPLASELMRVLNNRTRYSEYRRGGVPDLVNGTDYEVHQGLKWDKREV